MMSDDKKNKTDLLTRYKFMPLKLDNPDLSQRLKSGEFDLIILQPKHVSSAKMGIGVGLKWE